MTVSIMSLSLPTCMSLRLALLLYESYCVSEDHCVYLCFTFFSVSFIKEPNGKRDNIMGFKCQAIKHGDSLKKKHSQITRFTIKKTIVKDTDKKQDTRH